MNIKSNKGSIAIFVLIGLLFMTAFLLIAYSSNVNKAKSLTEQFNIVSKTYNPNSSNEISYTDAYTDLRKTKNFSQLISSEKQEDTNILELENTYLDDKLTNYKIYGNGSGTVQETHNLPDEYQEVEYIESTGKQYIDTGWKPLSNKLEIDFKVMCLSSMNSSSICGSENRNYLGARWLFTLYGQGQGERQYLLIGNWNNGSGNTYISTPLNTVVSANIKYDNGTTTCLSNQGDNWTHIEQNDNITNHLSNLNLFQNLTNQKSIIKMYSFKIYDNDILVRNFIPCYRKSDKIIGMYDLAENQFYSNSGTGEFIKGEEIIEGREVGDLITNEFDEHYEEYKIELKVSNKENESYSEYIYLNNPLLKNEYIEYKERKVYRKDGTIEDIELPDIKLYEDYTKIEIIADAITPKVEAKYKKYDIEGENGKYQPLEYIESTGTQYIDTAWKPLSNKLEIDFKIMCLSSMKSSSICGSENTNYTGARWLFTLYGQGQAERQYPFIGSWANGSGDTYISTPLNTVVSANIKYDNGKTTCLSNQGDSWTHIEQNDIITNHLSNLNLFQNLANQKSIIKMYSFKIYDNDILVRNFIPCCRKSDNVIGMYDIANDVFYTNSGTGEFIAGPEVSWSQVSN